MSDLAYRDTPILSTLLREIPKVSPLVTQLPKVSPLVRQIHPEASSLFKDRCLTHLPDKKLLQAKLHEFYLANVGEGDAE
jgi:hypothetical protein